MTGQDQQLSELTAHYAGKHALVTGGLGFIGSNLVRSLVALSAEVVVVDALVPDTGASRANLAGVKGSVRLCVADIGDAQRCRRSSPAATSS